MNLEISSFVFLIPGISRENSYIFFIYHFIFYYIFFLFFFLDRPPGIEALVSKVMVREVER